jgi:FkbM family methyltransferase
VTAPFLESVRRAAGVAKRQFFPSAEVAAWRRACRVARRTPRFTPGHIRLLHYDLQFADLLTLCPPWEDLFVRQMHRVASSHPTPRILDAGAHVGLATLYFKRLYPHARITAYEADPMLHALLVENLRRNGAADVEAVHAAVWTENGTVDFRCEGADSGTIEQFAGDLRGVARSVPSVRLRHLLEAEPIDLLKLDIEGAELDVLADCRSALRSVGALLLDVHEFDPSSRRMPAILDILAATGFTYTLDALTLLPWRPPTAPQGTPFAARALCWALLVRAWKAREARPSG